MIITGHRGAANLVAENTLLSMQTAIDLGVDQIETDVHLTKDQQLVIMHDQTVDRTTNGTGRVAESTLAQIKRLDAGEGGLETQRVQKEVIAHLDALLDMAS